MDQAQVGTEAEWIWRERRTSLERFLESQGCKALQEWASSRVEEYKTTLADMNPLRDPDTILMLQGEKAVLENLVSGELFTGALELCSKHLGEEKNAE